MQNKKAINLIGAGGHAKVIGSCAMLHGYSIDYVFDQDLTKVGNKFWNQWPIDQMPDHEWWNTENTEAIIAIGANNHRKKIVELLDCFSSWSTLIHPSAFVDASAVIGEGSFIAPHVTIHPDAIIGRHVIINSGAVIEHDSIIEDYCHIAPNAVVTGHSHCEEGVLLGVGAQIIPSIKIGAWSVIGAGSTVIKDIPKGVVGAGSPVKIF